MQNLLAGAPTLPKPTAATVPPAATKRGFFDKFLGRNKPPNIHVPAVESLQKIPGARGRAEQMAAANPDLQKLLGDLTAADNKGKVDDVLKGAGALSPALAGLDEEAKADLAKADTAEKVQARLAKIPGMAELFKADPAAAARIVNAERNALAPTNFFKALQINLAQARSTEEKAELSKALGMAQPFNGPVVQVVNDGNPSTVTTSSAATIVIPQATYGAADVNSLLRVSLANSNGDLLLEVGNFNTPGATVNRVIIPQEFASSTRLAFNNKTPTGPDDWHSALLPQIQVTGASAADQALLLKLLNHELVTHDLAKRFLDIEGFAKLQGKSEPELMSHFKQTLATAKHESISLGEIKANKGAAALTNLPVLSFSQINKRSLRVEMAKFDSKTLTDFASGLVGKLANPLQAKVREIMSGADVLFLALKATETAVAVPNFKVNQDLTISSQAKTGEPTAVLIKAGTILAKEDRALLEAMIAKEINGVKYSVDASLTKALSPVTTYVISHTNPTTNNIESGMIHLDSRVQVVAVPHADAGLFSTDTLTSSSNVGTTIIGGDTKATTTASTTIVDANQEAVSAKHLNPTAVSHETTAIKDPNPDQITALLKRFEEAAKKVEEATILGENPAASKDAKLPSVGWFKGLFGKN